jgi:hypothetical protein
VAIGARSGEMSEAGSSSRNFLLAAVIGAVCAGVVVIGVTKAIPTLMSKMMSAMMQNMMAQFPDGACSPEDL